MPAGGALARRTVPNVTTIPYDNASISASLSSPGTMVTGIGNEPTALAIKVTSGPGPS